MRYLTNSLEFGLRQIVFFVAVLYLDDIIDDGEYDDDEQKDHEDRRKDAGQGMIAEKHELVGVISDEPVNSEDQGEEIDPNALFLPTDKDAENGGCNGPAH